MKILIVYRLARYIATYHFLSFLVVFLALDVSKASGRSDLKTKLLLQNIRTHLAQKADEIVKKKECDSGLILCKDLKNKDTEGNEDKSEEIPPPGKSARDQRKPVIKISTKDVIQTLTSKAPRSLYRKSQKIEGDESHQKKFYSLKISEQSNEADKSEETTIDKVSDSKKPSKFLKQLSKKDENFLKSFDVKLPKLKKNLYDELEKKLDVTKNQKKLMKREKAEVPNISRKTIEKKKEKRKAEAVIKGKKKDKSFDKMVAKEEIFELHPGAFIFVLDSDDNKNYLCKKHSQIYVKQLKKYRIWALMMYDASAKFTSGILQGNVNQYGDFDECLTINAVFKKSKDRSKEPSGIKGKYCLANIDVTTDLESENFREALERAESFQFIKSSIHDPGHFIPRFSTVNWGLCVPSACLADDVEKFLKSKCEALNNATGLNFDIKVDESNCVVKDDLNFKFQTGTTLTVLFYLAILSISMYATFIDSKAEKTFRESSEQEKLEHELAEAAKDITTQHQPEIRRDFGASDVHLSVQDKTKEILLAFSIKKNAEKLLSGSNRGAIECINGVKSIFTIMLYFAHKTIPLGMTPFTNRIFLTKISNQPITILLRGSIIYTDSFLLISGMLTSYNLAKEISKKKKINWVKKSIARFIRLTPALLAVILFYAYVWDRLGSGPIWNLIINKNSSLCQKYMWRNLLYIQNLFAFENMCAPQTHQLALDMQLSLLAPFFVHLLQTYDKAGIGILQALFILSSIIRYITTFNNELSVVIYHGMSVSQLYKTANLLYSQTFHRASPYIMGTIVGYHLRKYENQFDMPKAFAALGWILSFTFGFYSIVSSSHLALKAYQYDVQEAAQYAALSPVAWSLALSWLIVACHLGYGGILNEFLCQRIFLIFSRISYSVYLTQFLIFFYKVGIQKIPEMFTFAGSINATEFFIVIGVSVILTLLFDIPMMEVKKILLDKNIPVAELAEDVKEEQSKEEQSTESFQMEDEKESETISSEEITEELVGVIEDEDEYVFEGGNEDADVSGDEVIDGDEGEIEEVIDDDEGDVEEVFEIRPLRRSLRMDFRDDSEDKECFIAEPEIEEDEQE